MRNLPLADCDALEDVDVDGVFDRAAEPLALYPANSIFIGDYLTTPGQAAEADYRMIADLGFEIEECAL